MGEHLREAGKGDHVYIALKKLVASGRFRPGEKLGIRKLADELGVSTTPVREGLIKLGLEEFILPLPSEGFFTKPFDVGEIRADLELVFIIGKYGIEANVDGFSLNGIRNPPTELDAVPSDDIISDLVNFLEQLTERLSSLTGNGRAVRVVSRSSERLHHIRLIALEELNYRQDILSLAEQLLRHLIARQSDLAVALLQRLMERQIQCLPELVNEANGRALRGHRLAAMDASR